MSGLVIVMYNLKERPLAGFKSNGMVLCASNSDKSQIEIVRPGEGSISQIIKYIKNRKQTWRKSRFRRTRGQIPIRKTTNS